MSGYYGDAAGKVHSFVWVSGQTITIDKPSEAITAIASIDDKGRVFGNWGTDSEQHAGYYDLEKATWTQLPDIPGYPVNVGSRMNNEGRAVGLACQGTFFNYVNCVGWSWDGEKYDLYTYPTAISTLPNAINKSGKEVGIWVKAPYYYLGYSRLDGVIEDLTLITNAGTFHPTAYDINDSGAIVAAAPLDPTGYWPTFILRSTRSFTLLPNYPGVLRTFYQGMNEREDLVGVWFNDPSASRIYGFVAFTNKKERSEYATFRQNSICVIADLGRCAGSGNRICG